MDPTALEWHEVALRLLGAAVLGGVIGLERGASGHVAGLRTHVLVAVGSGLFAVLSVGAFDEFIGLRSSTNVNVDVTRIAAYVAPGIGFIGAGVIVKNVRDRGSPVVLGLTTAASLWAAAAIGVSAGLGFWTGAVTAAVIALAVLVVARPLSAALEARNLPAVPVTVSVQLGADRTPSEFVEQLIATVGGATIRSTRIEHRGVKDRGVEHGAVDREDQAVLVVLDIDFPAQTDLSRLAVDLHGQPDVRSVQVTRLDSATDVG